LKPHHRKRSDAFFLNFQKRLYTFFIDANAILFLFLSILNIVFLVAQQHIKSSISQPEQNSIKRSKIHSNPSFVNGKTIKIQK
jgi:hypothetical protein